MIAPEPDFDADADEPPRSRRVLGALLSRRLFVAWLVVVAGALIGGALWDGPAQGVDTYVVYDGDTLTWTPRDCFLSSIGLSCLPQRLRLYGVDAFETDQTCADADGKLWACGAVATQHLRELTERPTFSCNVDSEFLDRRAREFAVCTVDGKDVGAIMVADGLAFYYGRGLQYLPIEAEAKDMKRGAWSGNFVRPQFWRQGARP